MEATNIWAAAVTAIVCAGPLQAHHSGGMFDGDAPVWVRGAVVQYSPINPHAMIVLERSTANEQAQPWTVEGPSLNGLARSGLGTDFLTPGQVIEVCGFPFKEEAIERIPAERRDRIPPPIAGSSQRPTLHGYLLVMPDGRMRRWGPYGKLESCIRSRPEVQVWVDFLNSDAVGRAAWCNGKARGAFATLQPEDLFDEIDRGLAESCR